MWFNTFEKFAFQKRSRRYTEGNKGSKIEILNGVIDDPLEEEGRWGFPRREAPFLRSWRGLNDEPLENNPSVAFTDALFFHSRSSPVSLSHAHTCVRLFRSDRWYGHVFVSRLAPTIVALPGQNGSTIGSLKKKKKRRVVGNRGSSRGRNGEIHRGSGSPRSDHIVSCRQHVPHVQTEKELLSREWYDWHSTRPVNNNYNHIVIHFAIATNVFRRSLLQVRIAEWSLFGGGYNRCELLWASAVSNS